MKGRSAAGWLALSVGLALTGTAQAQAITPVAAFDLNTFSGAWYEVLRSPEKDKLQCVEQPTVLYSLVGKPGRFANVRSCKTKGGFMDARNSDGRLADLSGSGALKVRTIWPFWHKFDVIALGPDDAWAVLATTNHKAVWVLARQTKTDAETLTQLRQKVSQLGFDGSGLVAFP